MIHVLATITVAPGRRDEFLDEFRRIISPVRAETGCLEYGPATDVSTAIPAQAELGSDKVVVIEKWESLDALEAHLGAPHMETYRERVKDLVLDASLQILQPA